MEKCKTVEKRLEILLELFKVWSLFVLAWATALGTLVYKAPQNLPLLLFSTSGLLLFSISWVIIFVVMWNLTVKLENCKED
jgi:predicted membrane protein